MKLSRMILLITFNPNPVFPIGAWSGCKQSDRNHIDEDSGKHNQKTLLV
jgi:hypothetical protein